MIAGARRKNGDFGGFFWRLHTKNHRKLTLFRKVSYKKPKIGTLVTTEFGGGRYQSPIGICRGPVPNLHTGHVILGSSDILICPNCVVSDQTLITFPFWVPGYETKWEGIPKERFETTNGGDYRIATVFRQISVDVKYATG
jgi:hypothetical protein